MLPSFHDSLNSLRGTGPAVDLPRLPKLAAEVGESERCAADAELEVLRQFEQLVCELFRAAVQLDDAQQLWLDLKDERKTSEALPDRLPSRLDLRRMQARSRGRSLAELFTAQGYSARARSLFVQTVLSTRLDFRAAELRRIGAMQDLKRRLLFANLKLVFWRSRGFGHDQVAALVLGSLGICTSIDRFDTQTGNRLGTMARYWIRARMTRASSNARGSLRFTASLSQCRYKGRRVLREARTAGNEPSPSELATTLGVDSERLRFALMPTHDDSAFTAADPSGGPTCASFPLMMGPEIGPLDTLWTAAVAEMEKLPERRRGILEQRLGLDGVSRLTLSEIGKKLGLSRERVRQLESQAKAQVHEALAKSFPKADHFPGL